MRQVFRQTEEKNGLECCKCEFEGVEEYAAELSFSVKFLKSEIAQIEQMALGGLPNPRRGEKREKEAERETHSLKGSLCKLSTLPLLVGCCFSASHTTRAESVF